ncbi:MULTISPECIES: amino acid ABC transporter permease [Streptomyces]|uniref:Glutamate ABC transporter permease protein n=1 Tax=Streptomyces griseus subsp. griseus (strain JCM 4626 / CBS 651.72 / NBRC 13350 / KCC S-0626 / ISP 5235) TaxID=455632 RepID=B1VV93_STRGG|nr:MULTISPECIES: amino acid ABC transporter permease [Streptomyces]MYR13968.1 ABC transporter permease subunit [Streptomyces sp. SID724]NEB55415.1 amino acid ABC transporter permease [Streptomyces griseus]SCE48619.1 amino acid ABC transporter membrane protein 2, PAAT family [Streptomyces sp. OspMP-M43]SED58413.1 amino acid ABC transporter membrane protein 2, PAAT family [Streptomyces griseus]SQA22547.1 glutamate ABC transporter permease [Streptomyces griseus]
MTKTLKRGSARPTATALYDIPGPVARRRHLMYGIASTAVIVALFGWIVYLLFDTDQFTAEKWTPFEYKGIQELLLRGLGNTLKAFAYAAVLSLLLGAVLAVGRLSEHRVLRWLSTLLVEFFRAMPVLVMIFFIFVALKVQPLPALVAGLTLYNGSVLAEVFRTGINSVDRGQREAAYALGMRKTQVTTFVLAPQAVRAMLPTIISQLVVALKDTSLGYLITYEEFLHAGKLIASNLDYDLPFIPVVMVISPIYIGMCMLLSWFATWVARRQRRNPRTEAVGVAPAEPGTLLPGGQ